jgi:electron transfer flavoprotein alpha subunit
MSGILVVAEHLRGAVSDISRELIGAACRLREQTGGPVRVLLVADDPAALLAPLQLAGVDEILTVAGAGAHFDPAVTEAAAHLAALHCEPEVILLGHTSCGMSYAAALAVRLGSGFGADIFDLEPGPQGLRATRGGYGAKVNIVLEFPGKPVVVLTLRGATFKPPEGGGTPALVALALDAAAVPGRSEHLAFTEAPSAGVDIGKAEYILSIGRGIQEDKNVARFAQLAERLGFTLGCSRPVADSGWLHKAHQVGLTGKVAANCKLYVALGISGAVQHLHGMKHVETIIAVNTDAHAPIFNVASHGSTLDVFEFADAIEKLL